MRRTLAVAAAAVLFAAGCVSAFTGDVSATTCSGATAVCFPGGFGYRITVGGTTVYPKASTGEVAFPAGIANDIFVGAARVYAKPTTTTTTSSTSTTSTIAGTPGAFPDASNTGVPVGTALTAYTGSCTITGGAVTIDAKTINCSPLTLQSGAAVTITRSKLVGRVSNDGGGTLSISDSEVDGGTNNSPALGFGDLTLRRVNVHGSRVSVLCGSNCDIEASWLHAQYFLPGSSWHVNGYLSNGGSNVRLVGNTLACDVNGTTSGGCTGPAASFGDFGLVANVLYQGNLFKASPGSYCLYGGSTASKPWPVASNVDVVNNTFERGTGKCAFYGYATAWSPNGGGVWSGNVWSDGPTVPAP